MKEIVTTNSVDRPPKWAVLERNLIDLINGSVDTLLEKYVNQDGSIMWPPEEDHTGIDALDDAYESFYNWPVFYLLGGDERFFDRALEEFEAITEQFSEYDTGKGHPMVVNEYEQGYDWMHQGEGYLLFYHLCMADPTNDRLQELASRFAGFYLDEDDDVPDLYDEDHKLILSPMVGSKGPAPENFSSSSPLPLNPFPYENWNSYHLPFFDLDGIDSVEDVKKEDNSRRVGEALEERCSRGDVPQNLAATTMVLTAYLFTGEEKYREWILEYVNAWMDRIRENDGLVPDNVGLSNEIGEYIDGKWYGGYYGWTFPHGWHTLGNALAIGAENAMVLSGGDREYLDLVRSSIDALIDEGITHEGTLHIPHKHGDPATHYHDASGSVLQDADGNVFSRDGWFQFEPYRAHHQLAHVWYQSMADEDRERLRQLRDYTRRDWEQVLPNRMKWFGGHEYPWIAFLDGSFPDYPAEILSRNFQQVCDRLEFMREDDQDPATYSDAYLQQRNPVSIEGLIQCTLGAPQLMYHGGLQPASVRYFDADRQRPGLPPDVGALVTDISDDRTVVDVINLGSTRREMIVQAGAFGEHQFTGATYKTGGSEEPRTAGADLDASAFSLVLRGGTRTTLDIEMERFANEPSFGVPWSA